MDQQHTEELSLFKAAELLLHECRMVLPGIQALLGFQLIAVFSSGFEKLGPIEQRIHLLAIGLVAMAVAIIMTPAAYNRQTSLREVTAGFIRLCTRLLLLSMLPLAVGICLDFYLIAGVVQGKRPGELLALALFTVFFVLWFALPRIKVLQRILAGPS